MDEIELKNRVITYLFYVIAVVVLIISLASGLFAIIVVSAAFLLFAIVYMHSGHIINNILVKRSKVVEIYNNHTLSSNLLSVFKKSGHFYKSVSVAIMKSDGTTSISHESMRSLIESMHEPFEFSIDLMEVDKKRIIEPLETKRRMKEIQLTKIRHEKQDRINNIKREIEVLSSDVENIKSSGKAFEIKVSLKATVCAESEAEATTLSSRNLERIADAFSVALKMEYEILRGEALLMYVGGE